MVDVIEMGMAGYQLYRDIAVVPDKNKEDLSYDEVKELTKDLKNKLKSLLKKQTNKQDIFNYCMLTAVIAYLNDCDISLYMSIDEKNEVDVEII